MFFFLQIIASFYHYSPAILTTAWLLCIFIMGTVGLVYNWTPACLLVAVYMQFFSKSHGGKMKRQQIAWRDSGFWNILGKWMTAWYRRLVLFQCCELCMFPFPSGLIIAKKNPTRVVAMEIHRFVTSINLPYACVDFIVFLCLILYSFFNLYSLSFFLKIKIKEVALI